MNIGISTVKRIMRSATDRAISTGAAYVVVQFAEKLIQEKTAQAEKLLDERNESRKAQGLRDRQRISEELLVEALNGALKEALKGELKRDLKEET